MVWLYFLLCVIAILFAGSKLARYGDAIAEKTGLGGVWIGMVLIALITSMPELATGIGSVALVKEPDLAVGTLLGSSIFNILILVVLDALYRRTPILSDVSKTHIIAAVMGLILTAVAAGSIFAGEKLSGFALGWLGVPSIIIFILYLAGMRWIYNSERNQRSKSVSDSPAQYKEDSVKVIWLKFSLAAAIVVGVGIWVAFIGEDIAELTGWETSFVGSMFLAISTSMPELVICIAALRLGAIDIAVADVLGANMINMAKIILIDPFWTQGSLLSSVSSNHLITAVTVIAMSFVVIIGLKFRQRRKIFIFSSWYSPVILVLYAFGAYNLFTSGIS